MNRDLPKKKKDKHKASRPGKDCNCPVCVFSKSQAPGDSYDLKNCPKWNSKKSEGD